MPRVNRQAIYDDILRSDMTKRYVLNAISELENKIKKHKNEISVYNQALSHDDPWYQKADTRRTLDNTRKYLLEDEIELEGAYEYLELWEHPFYKEQLEENDVKIEAKQARLRQEQEAKRRYEAEVKASEEREEQKRKHAIRRRNNVGRTFAFILALLTVVLHFIIDSYCPDPAGLVLIVVMSGLCLIPFIVIFFSSNGSNVLRIVFICINIAVNIGLLVFANDSVVNHGCHPMEFTLTIFIAVSSVLATIIASIFPQC